jgi:hypothetical protein
MHDIIHDRSGNEVQDKVEQTKVNSRDRVQDTQNMVRLQLGFRHSVLLGVLTETFGPIPTGQPN